MEHIREPLKKYVVVQNQIWSVVLLYLVWFSLLPAWMGGMGNSIFLVTTHLLPSKMFAVTQQRGCNAEGVSGRETGKWRMFSGQKTCM